MSELDFSGGKSTFPGGGGQIASPVWLFFLPKEDEWVRGNGKGMMFTPRVNVQKVRARWYGLEALVPSTSDIPPPHPPNWAIEQQLHWIYLHKIFRYHLLLLGTKAQNVNATPLRQKTGTWLLSVDLFTLEHIFLQVITSILLSLECSFTSTIQVRDENSVHLKPFREAASTTSVAWHVSSITNLTLLLSSCSQNPFLFLLMSTFFSSSPATTTPLPFQP